MAAMDTLCSNRYRAFNFIKTTILTSGACVLNNEYYVYYTEKNCLRIRTLTTMLRKMIELKLSDCYSTDNVSCFTLSKLPLMLANNNAMLADKNEITRTKTKYTHIHYI